MAAQRREPRKTRRVEAEASRPRESVRARVHALLRARITSLELLPGAPLSENELAAELDVSRTPVREALILLGEESLVDVFPKLGTFVSRISVDAVLEAQFMREALEVAALREAVTKSGAQDITALRAILDAQRAALKAGDADVFFEQDEAFHRRLMEASGHRTLWRTVATAKAHLDRARRRVCRCRTGSRRWSTSTPRWSTPWNGGTRRARRTRCADTFRASSTTSERSGQAIRSCSRIRTSSRAAPRPARGSIPGCAPDVTHPGGGSSAGRGPSSRLRRTPLVYASGGVLSAGRRL